MVQRKGSAMRNPMRSKALLAIAFAGGVLNSQLPALSQSESKSESTDSEIQKIAKDRKLSPKYRALYLLQLANENLPDSTQADMEAQLSYFWFAGDRRSRLNKNKVWDEEDSFISRMMYPGRWISASDRSGSESSPITDEKLAFANRAVGEALLQLDKSTEKFATLNLYVIASRLFQKTGNRDGVQRCERILEDALQTCEQNKHINETQITEATSALKRMANSLIPVYIPFRDPKTVYITAREPKNDPAQRLVLERVQPAEVKPFTQKDFLESEKLKLRAIAIVDRLPPENHLRRKAHRDLVLWYMQLGKNEMAEREKQLLFELVGIRDDSILYPQDGACGHIVWWQRGGTVTYMGCGMG